MLKNWTEKQFHLIDGKSVIMGTESVNEQNTHINQVENVNLNTN